VFGDQVLATAILDRLLHHSSTINIKGESFRLKEKRRAGLLTQQAPENTAAPAKQTVVACTRISHGSRVQREVRRFGTSTRLTCRKFIAQPSHQPRYRILG